MAKIRLNIVIYIVANILSTESILAGESKKYNPSTGKSRHNRRCAGMMHTIYRYMGYVFVLAHSCVFLCILAHSYAYLRIPMPLPSIPPKTSTFSHYQLSYCVTSGTVRPREKEEVQYVTFQEI